MKLEAPVSEISILPQAVNPESLPARTLSCFVLSLRHEIQDLYCRRAGVSFSVKHLTRRDIYHTASQILSTRLCEVCRNRTSRDQDGVWAVRDAGSRICTTLQRSRCLIMH